MKTVPASCLLLFVHTVHALEWDTSTGTPGAQGAATSPAVWNAANTFWWNGSTNVAWDISAHQPAVFGGTPGVVQLAGEMNARDFFFNTGGFTPPASSFPGTYEIKASTTANQRLILSSNLEALDFPDITVASGVRAIISTTHQSTGLAGGIGFTKLGAGTLILQQNTTNASSPLAGSPTVEAGRLIFDSLVSTTLSGINSYPNLAATSPIIVRNGATLQFDRSNVLGGSAVMGVKKIRLDSGGILALANARQYLGELDIIDGAVITTTRETTSTGSDENDSPALLTPNGGLLIKSSFAPQTVERNIATPIEIREGTLTFQVANGTTEPDLAVSGVIASNSNQNVIKEGVGTLRLGGNNTFQGDLVVSAGIVQADSAFAFGAATSGGNGEVRVSSGGAVDLNGRSGLANKNWFIAGDGPSGTGAILNGGADVGSDSRIVNLTLTANASIGGSGNYHIGWNPGALGPGSINGGGHTLTKRGNNEIRVRAASTNILWKVAGGTLAGTVTNAFGTGLVELQDGATLRGFGNVAFPNNLDVGAAATVAAGTGTATFSGNINLAAADLTFHADSGATLVSSGDINGFKGGPGFVRKAGPGTLLLNGNVPGVPGVVVHEGTLRGTGGIRHPLSSASLTVLDGAALAPGAASSGVLTVEGNVDLRGKLSFAVNGANSSKLVVAGLLDIKSTATLEFAEGNTYTQPLYILAEYLVATGSFATPPVAPPGYALDFNHNGQNRIALVAAPGNPYSVWTGLKGLAGNDALPDADPDRDGIVNAIEFVLGAEPNPANPGSSSAHLLPEFEVVSDTHVTFTFRCLAVAAYANPVVRYGNDLTGWTTAVHGSGGVTIAVNPNHYDTGIDRVIATLPRGGSGKLFARLQATIP